MYIEAIVNMISPEIAYGTVTGKALDKYSVPGSLHDKVFQAPRRYATLEVDRWALDGTFDIYPDDAADVEAPACVMSENLSGEDRTFEKAEWIEMAFSNVSVLQACSIYFSEDPIDGIPVDFTVEVKQGGTAYFTRTFTGNSDYSVSMDGFTVNNPDAIRVTVTKWSMPYRRMRLVEIVPGIYERWTEDMICALEINQEINPSCLSIPYGACTLKMDNVSRRFEPRSKSGMFRSIEEGQEIPVFIGVRLVDGTVEYKSVGVYYQHNSGWKTGDNDLSIQWSLVDIVGLLADRDFKVPTVLPTTLSGWLTCLVCQLGDSFSMKTRIDAVYGDIPVTAQSAENVRGKKCGEILRYACMAAGVFPRADDETGYLAAEPLWSAGNYIDLENLSDYPTMKANDDVSGLTFKLYDGSSSGTTYTISGNNTAAQPLNVDNPFIHTQAQAITAARNILSTYGGNQIDVSERGDPTDELGDVSKVQLDESMATSARRIKQGFSFSDGVLCNCPATLIQPDGSYMYQTCVVLTANQTWISPPGVTSLRVVIGGGGAGGVNGSDGTWDENGADGTDGPGGKILSMIINCNEQQVFNIAIGAGGAANGGAGGDTSFGAYSSASGKVFSSGYADIGSGNVYGRTGVELPTANSGDGGAGGAGGAKGEETTNTTKDSSGKTHTTTSVAHYPQKGTPGVAGGSGFIVVWYDKAVTS